jgi:hypothetical protein
MRSAYFAALQLVRAIEAGESIQETASGSMSRSRLHRWWPTGRVAGADERSSRSCLFEVRHLGVVTSAETDLVDRSFGRPPARRTYVSCERPLDASDARRLLRIG